MQAHMPDLLVLRVKDDDLILALKHLHALLDREEIRRRKNPALVGRVGNIVAAFGILAVPLHRRRGFRLQDRIDVIPDQRYGIAIHNRAAGIFSKPPQVHDRTGTYVRRLEIEHVAAPWAGKIGNNAAVVRSRCRPNKDRRQNKAKGCAAKAASRSGSHKPVPTSTRVHFSELKPSWRWTETGARPVNPDRPGGSSRLLVDFVPLAGISFVENGRGDRNDPPNKHV